MSGYVALSLENSMTGLEESGGDCNGKSGHLGEQSVASKDKRWRRRSITGHEEDVSAGGIVQFTSSLYFVEEAEGCLTIDVMRMGSLEDEVSVMFKTVDASATEGLHFKQAEDRLTFTSGEHTKEIKVELTTYDYWKSTLEFRVQLSEPCNCQLGVYLHTCRVKIIDQAVFPSNKFNQELRDGDLRESIENLDDYSLFWEYWKLLFTCAGVRAYTLLVACMDQMKNLYHLLLIYTSVYLVNTALNIHDPDADQRLLMSNRTDTLYLLSAAYVAPMLLLHCWDYLREKINLQGRCLSYLRINLFRKYLNYSSESLSQVDSGFISLALHSDVETLASGYMGVLALLAVLGKLGMSLYFTYCRARSAMWIIIGLPLFTMVWGVLRQNCLLHLPGDAGAKTKLLSLIHSAVANLELLDSYGKRSSVVDTFAEKAVTLQNASVGIRLFQLNTDHVVMWLSPLMIAVFICLQGPLVLSGDITLGAFLAIVKLIHEVSMDCLAGFKEYEAVGKTLKPLERVTFLLNCPTDLAARKKTNRSRRQLSEQKRDELLKQESGEKIKDDLAQIEIKGLSLVTNGITILKNCSAIADQGSIVALTGPHRCGKTLLMRLLCMKLFPTDGAIFVPMHLRVLFVPSQPVIMKLSAYDNLIFGLPVGRTADHARIFAVLNKLHMVETFEYVNKHLEKPAPSVDDIPPDDEDDGWIHALSHTERSLLNLARALISNPEVLVLQSPFGRYDESLERAVSEALCEHVENRGLCMPPLSASNRHLRRPRTFFYSAMEQRHVALATSVWQLEPLRGNPQAGYSIRVQTNRSMDTVLSPKHNRKQINRVHLGWVTVGEDGVHKLRSAVRKYRL